MRLGVNLIVDALMAFSFKLLAMDDADKSYPDVEILRAFNITDTGMSWDSLVLMAGASNHVMIGHNILHDLCFLYTMAIGKLPESMKLFCGLINGKLSRVIDTKVMAAQMTDEDAVDERLEDLFNLFKLQKNDPHGRSISSWGYNVENRSIGSGRGVAHEAGFDSKLSKFVLGLVADTGRLHDSHCFSEGCLSTVRTSIGRAHCTDRARSSSQVARTVAQRSCPARPWSLHPRVADSQQTSRFRQWLFQTGSK